MLFCLRVLPRADQHRVLCGSLGATRAALSASFKKNTGCSCLALPVAPTPCPVLPQVLTSVLTILHKNLEDRDRTIAEYSKTLLHTARPGPSRAEAELLLQENAKLRQQLRSLEQHLISLTGASTAVPASLSVGATHSRPAPQHILQDPGTGPGDPMPLARSPASTQTTTQRRSHVQVSQSCSYGVLVVGVGGRGGQGTRGVNRASDDQFSDLVPRTLSAAFRFCGSHWVLGPLPLDGKSDLDIGSPRPFRAEESPVCPSSVHSKVVSQEGLSHGHHNAGATPRGDASATDPSHGNATTQLDPPALGQPTGLMCHSPHPPQPPPPKPKPNEGRSSTYQAWIQSCFARGGEALGEFCAKPLIQIGFLLRQRICINALFVGDVHVMMPPPPPISEAAINRTLSRNSARRQNAAEGCIGYRNRCVVPAEKRCLPSALRWSEDLHSESLLDGAGSTRGRERERRHSGPLQGLQRPEGAARGGGGGRGMGTSGEEGAGVGRAPAATTLGTRLHRRRVVPLRSPVRKRLPMFARNMCRRTRRS